MNFYSALRDYLQKASPAKKRRAGMFIVGILAMALLLAMTGAGSPSGDADFLGFGFYLDVFFKVVGILLLIIGLGVLAMRWQKKRSTGSFTRCLTIIESIRIAPKQALHLVKAGEQYLLIGATDQTISLLTPLELEVVPEGQVEPSHEGSDLLMDFSTLLKNAIQPPSFSAIDRIAGKDQK